jgi:hypothetical protein
MSKIDWFTVAIICFFVVGGLAYAWYFFGYASPMCSIQYKQIDNMIKKSNYCQTDSDCQVLVLGGQYIQFGCYHFINKAVDKNEIYNKMDRYETMCSNMIDECMPSPVPECVQKKCVSPQ